MKLLDILRELDIKPKPILGKGSYHAVYDYLKDSTKIIKVPLEDIDETHHQIEIFKEHPDIFPIVHKVTDKYVILEKLDAKKAREDIQNLGKEIGIKIKELSDPSDTLRWIGRALNTPGNDISYLMNRIIFAFELNKRIISDMLTPEDSKLYFTLMSLINQANEIMGGDADIHFNNFGYDKTGKLKILDI